MTGFTLPAGAAKRHGGLTHIHVADQPRRFFSSNHNNGARWTIFTVTVRLSVAIGAKACRLARNLSEHFFSTLPSFDKLTCKLPV